MLCDIYSELSEDSNFRFDLHWARDLLKKCIKVYPKFFQLHATNIVQWNTWPKWKTSRWYRVSLFNSLSQVMSDVLDKKPALPHTHPHHPQLQNVKKKIENTTNCCKQWSAGKECLLWATCSIVLECRLLLAYCTTNKLDRWGQGFVINLHQLTLELRGPHWSSIIIILKHVAADQCMFQVSLSMY